MKKWLLFLLMFSFISPVWAEKMATFTDFNKPDNIFIDNELVVITEGTNIFLYSPKDFKLLKKFGKQGEGPQEFIVDSYNPLRIKLQPDYIQVNSLRKISYYTRKGDYIKELKHNIYFGFADFFPIGDQFVGFELEQKDQKTFLLASMYDANLQKIKEFYRKKMPPRQGQKFRILEESVYICTAGDKIFLDGDTDFIINIFDKKGEKCFAIQPKYEKLKFTDKDKDDILNYFQTNPNSKPYIEQIKSNLIYPDYFPAVRNFIAVDQKLYVQLFSKKEGKTEFYIFDQDGKFLEKVWLPIKITNPVEPLQLYTIYNGKLYQLIENIDEENWELHVNDIK
ncbi:MAG TPA: hypothetical protein VK186_09625 [Candidatus Deferrimicrobium sp.]|nr:hypothetical protein [Candidatus Kapabacteria bacterium]HLP59079.1 hypothetical protein [Candidatus Deferrimicrobium sp.]